jgi:hypothetical protein
MKGASRIGIADGQYHVKALEGTVSYQYSGKENVSYSLVYSGQEQLLDTPELLTLRKSPLWPKSYVRDDLGKSEEAPDKARGHSAVVFSRSNEKEHGRLKIRWAVFLPVDAAKEEVVCGGDSCYRITLHGYFFIDAGRVGIEGLQEEGAQGDAVVDPQNEVALRKLWNSHLARRGTLPLVLPALKDFITKAKLSADEIGHLSGGIEKSTLFSLHRKSICANSSWVCCLTPKGREWRILSSNQEILPLPGPPASASERPWKTLPKLESFQERGIALLLKDAPHLLARSLPQWNEEYLLEVLSLRENEVFSDQGNLDYLLQFMEDSVKPYHKIGTIQLKLRHIANQAFIELAVSLRQHRKKVQEFVAYILPENRYSLKPDAPQVIRELQQCKTAVIILAQEFDSPDSAGTAQLTLNDAFTLLKKLHDLIVRYEQQGDQEMIKHCRIIAREILQGQNDEQRRGLLVQAERLNILEGYNCLQKKLVAVSPANLKDRHGSKLLFLYSQGINDEQRRGLAPKLQKAIKETIILVNSKTAELVLGRNNDLSPCHADSALDSLGLKILPLQSADNRRQLLPDVAGADLASKQRVRGLRYLMHGLEKHFDDVETLWVPGYDQSPVWGKLWQQLGSHHEDGWNLLGRKLVEEIPPNKWPRLSIREIKPDSILDELREKGIDGISGEQFDPDERNAVLKVLDSDEKLWKKLPFHETVRGVLVCVNSEGSYLETNILIPDELLKNTDIIKRSNDPAVQRQQKDWLIPLSKEGVIRIVLQHAEPGKFWRLVMDNLEATSGFLDAPLFRDTPWLPDVNLISVKPSDVVSLEKIQDEVDRLLAIARDAFWSPGKLHADLQQHPSFTLLKEHSFARDREGFEKLALLLGETNEYHVGKVVCSEDYFDRIVQTCARLPVQLRLQGWVLLACALDGSQEMAKEFILPEILQPIDAERIITLLNWLQEEHVKAGQGTKKDILATFNAYLSALLNGGCRNDIISRLLLLNREGDWKPAKELCSEAEGIADSHLLDDDQKGILRNVIVHADRSQPVTERDSPISKNLPSAIKASPGKLKLFFAEWEGLVAPETICAFLSLLGNDPEMLVFAKQYRGRHSIEWIRDNITWDEGNTHGGTWKTNLTKTFSNYNFAIEVCDCDKVRTLSIFRPRQS